MIDQLAEHLFSIWRINLTGDVWRQLPEEDREAWRNVARAAALLALDMMPGADL